MTTYQQIMRDQLTRKVLFNERKRIRRASAEQIEAQQDHGVTTPCRRRSCDCP